MSINLTCRDVIIPVDWQDGELEYDGTGRPIIAVQAILAEDNHPKCCIVYAYDVTGPRELGRVPEIYAPPHLVRRPDGNVVVYGKGRTGRTMHLATVPPWETGKV